MPGIDRQHGKSGGQEQIGRLWQGRKASGLKGRMAPVYDCRADAARARI